MSLRFHSGLLLIATTFAVHCSPPVPVERPSTTSSAVSSVSAPLESSVGDSSDADSPTATAAISNPPPTGSARVNWMPNWTHNGSSDGSMVLRCENAFPPDDGSGKCVCEGVELNPCVDGTRQLLIDRKQCMFTCKPKPQTAKEVAVRCPDGSNPEASAAGCACSGRKPLDPCNGGIASAELRAGECVATCKKPQ